MSLIKYPYTNLHEINLDWLIEEVKKCYSPENPPDMAVLSVNGMTGDVTLYTDPAAVLPEIEGTTWSLGRTAAGTLVGIKFNKTLPLQRMNGNSLFNIYDEGNPPPYPVTSVNGRTGSVSVQEAFFSLTGDTITFITDSPDHSWSLDRATVDGSISLRLDTTNDTPAAYLEYVSDDETITRTIKLLTPDDIPSSAGVVSVNGEAGVVTLTGDDIAQEEGSAVTVASAINTLGDDVENITDKIGNTAMGTQATTITGAVKEHNTAITNINNKLGNVGNTSVQDQLDILNSNTTPLYKENNGATTAVSPSTWETIAQITLPAGAWLIIGESDFSLNQSGIRVLMITYSATDTANKPENSVLATGRAVLSRCRILRNSTETTVYLRVYHTSGESINCIGNLRCIRVNTTWTT